MLMRVLGGLPWWFSGKESTCSAGDTGSILGQEDPLEEGMASHSSILAWRIPWTEEPGGLSPWGHKESNRTEQLMNNVCPYRDG